MTDAGLHTLPDGTEHPRSQEFISALRTWVEPVVQPAGLKWRPHGHVVDESEELTGFFESDDDQGFMERFPHIFTNIDYGGQRPWCIDLWITYSLKTRPIEASLEADADWWLRANGQVDLAERLQAPAEMEPAVRTAADALKAMLLPPSPPVRTELVGIPTTA